jgi:hypothetical protein
MKAAEHLSKQVKQQAWPRNLRIEQHAQKCSDIRAAQPDLLGIDLDESHDEQQPSEARDRSERISNTAEDEQGAMAQGRRKARGWQEHEHGNCRLETKNAPGRNGCERPHLRSFDNSRRIEQFGAMRNGCQRLTIRLELFGRQPADDHRQLGKPRIGQQRHAEKTLVEEVRRQESLPEDRKPENARPMSHRLVKERNRGASTARSDNAMASEQ